MNNRGRKVKKTLRGFSGKIFGYTAMDPQLDKEENEESTVEVMGGL